MRSRPVLDGGYAKQRETPGGHTTGSLAGQVLRLSHIWMLSNSRLDRAAGLSDELADGCLDLLVTVFTLAGAL